MALNLNHNIEKTIYGNPYFLCFSTASWFSKIFYSTLVSLAHRNILFHVILVHHHQLDQVPRCQAINSKNELKWTQSTQMYFYCCPYMPFHVLIEVTKEIKTKFLNFFLLRLKLLILSVWKFCLIYPNLATHSHVANTQCAKPAKRQ